MIDLSTISLPELSYLSRNEIQAIEFNEFDLYDNAAELMENAGKSVADYIRSVCPSGSIVILAGPGNNGGDGYIAAKELADSHQVHVIYVDQPKTNLAENARKSLPASVELLCFPEQNHRCLELVRTAAIVIDAVFGVGLSSDLRPPYGDFLDVLESADITNIVSVDLPSGLDCDKEVWYGPAFDPTAVITMQYSKQVMENWSLQSEIKVVDIGFHPESAYLVGKGHVKVMWPDRDVNSYKGQNGRVMVIGGSDEFTGAPVLSGHAVLRVGVDTLRIAVPETIRDIVAGYNQDFIVVKVRGERHNSKSFSKFQEMTKRRHDVVVMGMGLSNHGHTKKFVLDIVEKIHDHVQLVLDADAIRPFKGHLDRIRKTNAIITPHKAELRVLVQESIPTDFAELVEFVMEKARENNLVILLKGKIDIITDGTRVLFNTTGHAGMTVGGTGDVLAGVVAGVNCFVKDKFYATAIAAHIMGLAGERAAVDYGYSLLASDISDHLPKIIMDLHN